MFSGLVETMGQTQCLEKTQDALILAVQTEMPFQDVKLGDSIALNGVCLTVTQFKDQLFYFKAMQETLAVSNLKYLQVSDKVNLERSLQYQGRIGGHLVQGHVDFVGTILSMLGQQNSAKLLEISCPPNFSKYLVNKGYVAIDGMSITLLETNQDCFTVMLIEHTQNFSIAGQYKVGSKVNIEVDILGKYIEKLVRA